MPTNAHRVGDDGNGRGLRYPTAFNEDILTDLDKPVTLLVLYYLITPQNPYSMMDSLEQETMYCKQMKYLVVSVQDWI